MDDAERDRTIKAWEEAYEKDRKDRQGMTELPALFGLIMIGLFVAGLATLIVLHWDGE